MSDVYYEALILDSRECNNGQSMALNCIVKLPKRLIYRTLFCDKGAFDIVKTGPDEFPVVAFTYKKGDFGERDEYGNWRPQGPLPILTFVNA